MRSGAAVFRQSGRTRTLSRCDLATFNGAVFLRADRSTGPKRQRHGIFSRQAAAPRAFNLSEADWLEFPGSFPGPCVVLMPGELARVESMKKGIQSWIAQVSACMLVGLVAFLARAHAQVATPNSAVSATPTPRPTATPFATFAPASTPRP